MLFYISGVLSTIHFLSCITCVFLFTINIITLIECYNAKKQVAFWFKYLFFAFIFCLILAIFVPNNLADNIYHQKQYDSLELLKQKTESQIKVLDEQLKLLNNN